MKERELRKEVVTYSNLDRMISSEAEYLIGGWQAFEDTPLASPLKPYPAL